MKQMNAIDKTIASLGLLGYIIWLGGSVIRTIISYDLFIPGTLELKKYSFEIQTHIVKLFELASPYTNISYMVMILTVLYMLIKYNKNIKANGWMFMSIFMLLLTVIPNSYLMWMDYKLAMDMNYFRAEFDSTSVANYFMIRFTKLSILQPIVMLSGITAAVLFVFRPLHNSNLEAENK